MHDGPLPSEPVDFFEEGVAAGKKVLELIGDDVAAFCDGLIKASRTYADIYQESISRKHGTAEKQHPPKPPAVPGEWTPACIPAGGPR